MDARIAKSIGTVIAFTILVGSALGALLYYVFPAYYPHWYLGILAFFMLFESLEIWFIESSSQKATPRQLMNNYLLTKVVKLFASVIFVSVYAFVVKDGLKNFVLIFILFYLLFLFMETLIFLKIEKRLKEKKH